MSVSIPRRNALSGALALAATRAGAADPPPNTSLLLSTRIATIAAPNPKAVADAYVKSLTYKVRESSKVTRDMAASWGAPRAAGQPLIMLSTDANPDVFLRIVGTKAVPGATARNTAGWSSFEMIVRDADGLYQSLQS